MAALIFVVLLFLVLVLPYHFCPFGKEDTAARRDGRCNRRWGIGVEVLFLYVLDCVLSLNECVGATVHAAGERFLRVVVDTLKGDRSSYGGW